MSRIGALNQTVGLSMGIVLAAVASGKGTAYGESILKAVREATPYDPVTKNMLYANIARLRDAGLIVPSKAPIEKSKGRGRPRKPYIITRSGLAQLELLKKTIATFQQLM